VGRRVDLQRRHARHGRADGEDVAAFLMWTAEPKLMARKQMGFTAVIMLSSCRCCST
jgi:ubiquinol-cytochrome c reductase cytochrome c1 subunit